jgi:hypothetical protein
VPVPAPPAPTVELVVLEVAEVELVVPLVVEEPAVPLDEVVAVVPDPPAPAAVLLGESEPDEQAVPCATPAAAIEISREI